MTHRYIIAMTVAIESERPLTKGEAAELRARAKTVLRDARDAAALTGDLGWEEQESGDCAISIGDPLVSVTEDLSKPKESEHV